MDERLVFASTQKLRWAQLGGLATAAALVLGGVYLDFDRVLWAVALLVVFGLAVALAGLEKRIRRPLPELRLSADGIEGAFGLIQWDDVADLDVKTRLGRARRIVVRLRSDAQIRPPTREFVALRERHRLVGDKLELDTGLLEIGPHALVREVERFRLSA